MSGPIQGWYPDPLGRHGERYFSVGSPTYLVRDGQVEGSDPPSPAERQQVFTSAAPPTYPSAPISPAPMPPTPMAPTPITPTPINPVPDAPEAYSGPPPTAYPSPDYPAPGAYPPPSAYPAASAYPPPGYSNGSGWPQPYPADPSAYVSAYPPPAPKRHRGRWIALVAAVVVVAGVVVGVLATRSPAKHDPTAGASLTPSVADTATTGYVFTSTKGHFRARFPDIPNERTIPEDLGGVKLTADYAAVQNPVAEVASETTSQPVAEDQQSMALAQVVREFAVPSNLTIDSQDTTTFRGISAQSAEFTSPSGIHLSALFFFSSSTRLYIIVAETGATYDELLASFEALP